MKIMVYYGIVMLGAIFAYVLSKGKTKKRKWIVWGATLMFVISPFFSFAVGRTYAVIVNNGWAAMIMVYIFPVIFVFGLFILLVGFFEKEETWY